MQWKKFLGLFASVQIFAVITPLHSASSDVVQAVFTAAALQEPQTIVYILNLSPGIEVTSASLLGLPGTQYFAINQTTTTLTVYNKDAVPPDRYSVTMFIFEAGAIDLKYVALTVDVTPEASLACELQLFGECSQSCVLDSAATYSYRCTCEEGYVLQQDKVTCLAFDPLPSLLVTTESGLGQLDLLTRQTTQLSLSGSVDYFDYLYDDKDIFYADNTQQVISVWSMETAEETVFLSYAPLTVSSVAVNWASRSLYYSTGDAIVEVDIETMESSTVHSALNQSRHLTFHANSAQSTLFWIETANQSYVIRRSFLNGSQPVDIVTASEEPLDLSVDNVNEDIYWITAEKKWCFSDFNGDNAVCFECFPDAVPSGIAVFEVFIYVSLSGSNRVEQIQKIGQSVGPTPVVYGGISQVNALAIVHPLKQPFDVQETDCSQCQQLCIVNADSVSCDCSPGFRLSSDGHSCYIDEISDIVLAQSVQSNGMSFNTVIKVASTGRELERLVDSSFGPNSTPVTGSVLAMDYNRSSNDVLYGDRGSDSVWRVSLSRLTSGQDDRELLFSGVHAWDIAFDWIDGKIYWSDDSNGSVGYTSISTTGEATITPLATSLSEPRGLDIDPIERQLYYVESGENTIWKFDVDSLLPEAFVTDLDQPSGLVIDHQSRTLYWTELSGRIGKRSLDSEEQEIVYENPSTAPVKIAVYREYLLWIDGSSGSFNILQPGNGTVSSSVPIVPAESTTVLSGLLVVGSNRQLSPGTYECVQNVPGCSHFCAVDEEDLAVCTCPPGYSGGTTCTFEGQCPVCTGGGSCVIQGSDVSCSCPPGFRGNECSEVCEEGTFGEGCTQQCTCMNGGDCDPVNGFCNCTQGYEGTDCSQPICAQECQNGGTCIAPDVCSCAPTYDGPTCELRVCTSDFCLNGGTCIQDSDTDLSCNCPSQTSGLRCQFVDVILFPQTGEMIAVSVSVPVGILFILVLVAVVVGVGIYYYVRCIPHRKTNPLESQEEQPPTRNISPELETDTTSTTSAGNTNCYELEQGTGNVHSSPYHVYVQT